MPRWDLATWSCAAALGPVVSLPALVFLSTVSSDFSYWSAWQDAPGRIGRLLRLLDDLLIYATLLPVAAYVVTALLGAFLGLVALVRGEQRRVAIGGLLLNLGALAAVGLLILIMPNLD